MIHTTSSVFGIYSIKDKHIGMHLPPFLATGDDEAKRMVADSIEPNSVLARFPADYQLIREGTFDCKRGISHDPEDMIPDVLCSITDIIRQQVLDETTTQQIESILSEEVDDE